VKNSRLINSETVFYFTLIVAGSIMLIVYITGLVDHRSLYLNSLITTTILSFIFFCFITTGLYKGWKLKDTLGKLTNYFSKLKKPKNPDTGSADFDIGDIGDGIEGCIFAIILWIIVGIFGTIILWAIGAFFWGMILVLAGILYWVIFRAYRLILKNGAACKNNAIIFISHYFRS
jgi:hypothetical protein